MPRRILGRAVKSLRRKKKRSPFTFSASKSRALSVPKGSKSRTTLRGRAMQGRALVKSGSRRVKVKRVVSIARSRVGAGARRVAGSKAGRATKYYGGRAVAGVKRRPKTYAVGAVAGGGAAGYGASRRRKNKRTTRVRSYRRRRY